MSDTAALAALLPELHIPRCPDAMRYQALRKAIARFGQDTGLGERGPYGAILEQVVPNVSVTVKAGASYMTIGQFQDWMSNADGLFSPFVAHISPDLGLPVSVEQVTGDVPNALPVPPAVWSYDTDEASATFGSLLFLYSYAGPLSVIVYTNAESEAPYDLAEPLSDALFDVKATFAPTNTEAYWLEYLIPRWGDAIVAGAEVHLKRMIGSERDPVPWSDLTGAMVSEQRYLDGVAEAKTFVFMQIHGPRATATSEALYDRE